MENLRKITKIKLGVMLSSMTLPIIIVVVMAVGRFEFTNQSIFYYWSPLPYIICALIEAYLAKYCSWVKYKELHQKKPIANIDIYFKLFFWNIKTTHKHNLIRIVYQIM